MIGLEHVAMWSDDIERLATFYAQFFDAQVGERYENPDHGFASRFLQFAHGCRLELMQTTQLSPVCHAPGAQRMGLTHLAFAVEDEAAVDGLTHRLARAGHAVLDPPRRTGDGYCESTVLDPDGNLIEITFKLSSAQ
jgi:lactoylglutathione lyase